MGDLVAGKVYRLNIYTLTSLSNADGTVSSYYYSGSYMDEFEFEIEGNGRQPIRNITREVWGAKSVIFIGDPTSGNMDLTFYPKTDATIVGAPFPGLESVQIAIELNDLEELDSDGDGIPDTDDVDDYNDGILDTVENTIGGTTYDPLGDEDGDKLPNYLDVRDDGTGDASTTNYTDVNNDGIPDIFDFDLDGIPNHLDLDADNDGIPDNIEAQTTNGYIAPSGAVGAGFTDADGDGLDDNYDPIVSGGTAGTAITPVNSDSATVTDNPDYLDLDSDEDGVSDTVEANLILSGTVGNNGLDNTYDNGDDYTDVNGVFDDTQTDNFPDEGADAGNGLPDDVNWRDIGVTSFIDSDGDGIPNFSDIDNDNDGIRDADEGFVACISYNGTLSSEANTGGGGAINGVNAEGEPDGVFSEIDFNNDVFVFDLGQVYPAGTKYQFVWRRKPGEPGTTVPIINESLNPVSGFTNNPNAPDSFQDAVFETDIITSNSNFRYIQITKQATPSTTDFQIDAIGIVEITDCATDTDPDGDGIPNYLDLDSDNDGIPDNIEGQASGSYIAPTGSVGANGLYNVYENNDTTSATSFSVENTDGDGFPDYIDTDSDNDGTSDNAEADLVLSGTVGINGLDNLLDNGDSYADVNGSADNTPFGEYPDNPSGGEIDWRDETSVFIDTDNDGVPNSVDLDDDNDGILDVEEGLRECGVSTLTTPVRQLGNGPVSDTQEIDLSSLGLQIGDQVNISNLLADGDMNNAGVEVFSLTINGGTPITNLETGLQCNGSLAPLTAPINETVSVIGIGGGSTPGVTLKVDYTAAINFCTFALEYTVDISCSLAKSLDTDLDGIPNYLDLDSDNDGIPDNIEAQTTQGYTAPDGIYDANGVDTAYTGGLVPEDTDADTFPDYIDTDADDDGLLDNTEAGLTLTGIYGNNGLDNAYDNGDNYLDVNGSFDTTQTDNFPDEDGDVLNAGDVDYRDDTFTIDNDGDNISDEADLDDDNDGIVDLIEFGTCSSNNGILNWDNEYAAGDTVITNGDDPITTNPSVPNANLTITLSRTSNVNSESNYRINDATTTNSSYNLNQAASSNALSRHTFNFSAPVFGATFTIYDVNQDVATIAADKVQVIITKQDGTNYTLIPANYTVGATNTYLGTNTFQGTGTGASNVVINSIDEWITQIQIVYENEGTGSLTDFQNIAIGNIAYCTPVDTDGDGVFDFRDLDADNDGIPDNIEAQSTQGYIPPTGNYSLFGIDLAYDTGITPENTDGDSEPDYLDLDSDNEGAFDIVESGSGLTDANTDGVADGVPADFGTNGLINSLDDGAGDTDGDGFGEGTGDNYKDVNGTFDDTQNDNFTDSDTDVNIGGDVDYRDDIFGVDSDGDGIINSIDIDDDNDGIPDVNEDSQIISFATSPDAYWPLDGNTDDAINTNDERSNGATPGYSTDAIQGTNSADFNGTTNTIRYSQDGTFMESTYSEISFSAWIKPDDVSGQRIIYEEGGGTNGVTLWIDNGSLTFSSRSGGAGSQRNVIHPTSLTVDGEWHHVAATFNNGILSVFLDGVPQTLDISGDYTTIPGHGSDGGLGGPIGGGTSGGISGFYDGLMDAVRYSNTSTFSATEIATEATKISNSDFDGDGVINSLDIDADNDGIPDNVEAQTTLGYVSPSGVDTDNDGLDDAYDTDCTPCGAITGVDLSVTNNHDGLDNPDFIDTDSDNDGILDIEENGFTDNTVSGTDTDNDGLDDNFEGADVNDDYDVNDEINTPATDLPDEDSDVNTTGNVDYRDDTEDPITPGVVGNTLWLRADLDVTGGANVTLWEDQTASLDFTATATEEPDATLNLLNFNPTVTFNPANNDGLSYTGNLNPATMYIVYNDTSTAANVTPFTNDDPANTIGHGFTDDSQIFGPNTALNVRNGQQYVSGLTSDFETRPRPDNFELHSRVFAAANNWNSNFIYTVGRDRNIVGRVINGSVAEVMLFSDLHSDAKRQQVKSYLATKYGFTLDDTDNSGSIVEGDYVLADGVTKVWNYTNNSTFHNDVAGIGRDDAMALNQKQSKSVNSDAIITIGLDAITASNATNLNTFTSNKNFLMWGNNNGVVNSISETELICAPEKTIGRAWKVVENGSVGTTQIAVNKATIDAALVTPNTVKVFKVADDASFTTNVQYMPVTSEVINSENVYTVDFDFNGIKYFTYSEINGIFWNGDMNAWVGGNSGVISGGPSTNAADRNKVMVIDAQTSLTHAVLTENVNVECVWIKENSKLMVSDDRYLEFDEDFILDGEMRLIGDGQLVQTHTGLSNVEGTGKLYRDQQAIVPSIYRYHYWSSPVRELNLNTYRVGQVMKDGNVPTSASSTITEIDWTGNGNIYDGAPGTAGVTPIKIAPYWIYTYLNGTAQIDYKQTLQTGPIKRGQGYTMKSTGAVPQNFTFVGTPNDGSITFDFSPNTTSMLGNPYPSALDATDFINTNIDKIDGTLYFWEHTGEDSFTPATSEGHNLTGYQGGYSQRNISMGIAANGVGTVDPLVFDWTTAVDNGTNISQTVDGVEVIVTRSSGTFELLPNLLGVGGTIGNIIGNTPLTTSSYDVTFDFNGKVDLKSIYLFNNVVLPLTNPTVTITPNGFNTPVTQELSGVTGQEITLDWEDVTSFTITTDIPYNLVIDDLKFTKGNLPSLGDGTYRAPNRYIAVGQGFFVSSSETGGTVRFENSQRNYQGDVYASGGTYFFKSEKKEKAAKSISNKPLDLLPRLKLGFNYTVTGSSKAHRQIGISFRRTNTFGFDNGYDSEIYDLGNTDFYWNFPEYSDKNLIITGVPAITKEMEIPLTIVIGANNPFEIQIDEIKNINKDVYLLDKLTNTYYTLSTTPIELDVPVGTYNDRFYITFTNQNALSTENVNPLSKEVNVYLDNSSKEIVIENSNLLEIKKVEVYNLLGQKVKTFKNLETATVNRLKTSKLPTMVYIINLETENGKLSKKVIIE